jgi:LVIVD repeat-containing protein
MRQSRSLIIASVFAVAAVVGVARSESLFKPARYLYVWAGTGDAKTKGVNSLVVIDVDPASPKYGTVINALTVDTAGNVPHHTEFDLPSTGFFFANDYGADRSYMIDFSDPANPSLKGQTVKVPSGHMVHSFARLPGGNVLGTVQHGDEKIEGHPGGLAEFDNAGRLIRYTSSQDAEFPGARIRTYALTTLPAIDRVVTTSSPMDTEKTANVVQVWRMSDLKLLKTLALPEVADSADTYPFEVRALADGKTALVNTYYCGFYRLTGLESDPKIERVMVMDHPKNIGCSVPIIVGKYMVMPIAYAHRYATIDISNPAKPVEVGSLEMDSTFYPHWISRDPGSDRVVATDQGDGPPMVMLGRFDAATGKLTWDNKVKLSFANVSWPNGVKGKATPHGAVFVP